MDIETLKYLSVFFVFITGLFSCFIPSFIIHYISPNNHISTFEQCFRNLTSGIMISLATVHLFPDAEESFIEITNIKWSGICVVLGILIMIIIENIVHHSNYHHHHDTVHIDIDIPMSIISNNNKEETTNTNTLCVNSEVKIKTRAILLEIGCIFHSIIIGISLGIIKEEEELITLLIGLCFHQFLEGLGIGTIIFSAKFSKMKTFLFKIIFSITVPIGILIGISIESYENHMIQGIFNSISCGLLLYVSLVQLIAEDFLHHKLSILTRVLSIITFSIGSLSMILISVYGEK